MRHRRNGCVDDSPLCVCVDSTVYWCVGAPTSLFPVNSLSLSFVLCLNCHFLWKMAFVSIVVGVCVCLHRIDTRKQQKSNLKEKRNANTLALLHLYRCCRLNCTHTDTRTSAQWKVFFSLTLSLLFFYPLGLPILVVFRFYFSNFHRIDGGNSPFTAVQSLLRLLLLLLWRYLIFVPLQMFIEVWWKWNVHRIVVMQ